MMYLIRNRSYDKPSNQPIPAIQSQKQEIQKLKASPSPQPPAQQKTTSPPKPTLLQKI